MITPIFRIFDIEIAHWFYIKYLGFTLDWKHQFDEGVPLYFQVSLKDAVIHLSEHHGDSSPGSAIRIKMDEGLERYHSALSEKGYEYSQPAIEKAPWETIEFTVIDPFSNRITFYQEMM